MLQRIRRIAVAPSALWLAFLVVHAWLVVVGITNAALPFGDVTLVYRPWVENALQGQVVGITEPWVYPVVALLPMLAAMVLGPQLYLVGWLMVVIVTNAAVFAFLLSRGRLGGTGNLLRVRAAWWWLAFLLLLGPVALGRIDVMAVAFAIVGLLVAQSRPAVAGALLAIAAWIKVWPAALIAVLIITIRRRVSALVAALVVGVTIGVGALLAGSGMNLFGFIGEQAGRGLQIESPVSNIWLWIAAGNPQAAQVYYDRDILTFQVSGAGTAVTSDWMTPLTVVALVAVLLLGVFVVRTGAFPTHVLPTFSLAVVTALIVFNKVGSPQFVLWLAAPVVLGLVSMGNHFRVPAYLTAGIALMTQLVYPFAYDQLLMLNPGALLLLTIRNILLAVLLGLSLRMMWQSRRLPRKAFRLGH